MNADISSVLLDKSFSFSPHPGMRISWPGMKEPMRMWIISDTHLSLRDSRDDEYADNYRRMGSGDPEINKTAFLKTLEKAKEQKPDILVLTGDIISFPTYANIEFVKQSLTECGLPWIYVAGNHDWHFEGVEGSDLEQREKWIAARLLPLYQGANPFYTSKVIKGVRLVMIDNSAYHILPEQVRFWKSEAAKGDPVCLCMHIPFWQEGWSVTTCACPTWGAATDPYWEIERRQRWDEKLSPATFEFRKAVLETPNLAGVFAGHEHCWQFAREKGQNLITVASNARGEFLPVTIS